jgi:hypothetical protein
LRQIHRRAPKAAIRVLLYPLLFEDIRDDDNAVCRVGVDGFATLTGKRTNRLNKVASDLNRVVQDAVNEAKAAGINIEAVDSNGLFKGHRLCNTGHGVISGPDRSSYYSFDSVDAWIHGVILQEWQQLWSPFRV